MQPASGNKLYGKACRLASRHTKKQLTYLFFCGKVITILAKTRTSVQRSPRGTFYTQAEESRLVGVRAPPPSTRQILAIWRWGRGILRVPVRGISTHGVLNQRSLSTKFSRQITKFSTWYSVRGTRLQLTSRRTDAAQLQIMAIILGKVMKKIRFRKFAVRFAIHFF